MPRIVSFAKARELLVRVKKSGRRIVLATSSSDLQEDHGHGGPGRGRGYERGCVGFETGAGYFCCGAEEGGGERGGGDCAGGYCFGAPVLPPGGKRMGRGTHRECLEHASGCASRCETTVIYKGQRQKSFFCGEQVGSQLWWRRKGHVSICRYFSAAFFSTSSIRVCHPGPVALK
jgi:hypothetical protein